MAVECWPSREHSDVQESKTEGIARAGGGEGVLRDTVFQTWCDHYIQEITAAEVACIQPA